MKVASVLNVKYLLILSLLVSCLKNPPKNSPLEIINVSEALNKTEEVNLSQFVNSIEYIPLEETDQSLLFGPLIEVTDEFIIARNSGAGAMGPILLFDRKTGKFLRGVGKSGRGPEEFQMGNLTIYNIYNKTLYAIGYNHDIKEYDTDGNFLGSFKLPFMIDEKVPMEFGTPEINLDQYLGSDILVACIRNSTGWDKRRIVLFTSDSIIKVFPNYLFWKREDWRSTIIIGEPVFFRWDDKLNIKEVFSDTVFQITTTALIPRFVFKTKGYKLAPELQGESPINPRALIDEIAKSLSIGNICETKNFIFFRARINSSSYTGFFNKITKETTICKLKDTKQSAFIDDIYDFMPIWPQKITQNNEMIFKLEAEDITKWLTANPDKLKTFRRNMDWVKSISPTSNPVIVIAKLKD